MVFYQLKSLEHFLLKRSFAEPSMIKAYIYSKPNECRSYEIKKDSALIGREQENDIPINDASVSKKHAKVFKNGQAYFIKDLQSHNGTWIDGNIIKAGEKCEVRPGDAIALGNVVLSLGQKTPEGSIPNQYAVELSRTGGDPGNDPAHADTLMTDRRKLQQIHEITTSLIESLDIKEVFAKVIDALFLYFKRIDAGTILLIDEKTGKLKKAVSKVRDRAKNNKFPFSTSVVKQAVLQAKAIMIPDTRVETDPPLSESLALKRIVSAMCVPLITKAGIRGVIYVHSGTAPQGFQKEDLLFITSLGNPAAVAIENALLHEKNKRSEEALQMARHELKVKVKERTAELTEVNRKLNQLTMTDSLTGLFNHRYLMKALEGEFLRAVRYKRPLAMLLMDIDHFKNVNDSHGHPCGDMVLRETASLFKAGLRSSDVLARYGGDEIAVLLPEADDFTALEVAEKLRKALENNVFHWNQGSFSITCSAGVSAITDDGVHDWNQLLNEADKALYRAKESGRNAVRASSGIKRQGFLQQPRAGSVEQWENGMPSMAKAL
jgi:diguanylate cyclase (GGDEF)-like protein